MDKNLYQVVSGVFFALIFLLHLARLILGLHVQVDTWTVPLFVSWIGIVITGMLCVWAFRQKSK